MLLEAFCAVWVQFFNRASVEEIPVGNAWSHVGLQRVGRGMRLPLEHPLRDGTPILSAEGAA